MAHIHQSRRDFLKATGLIIGGGLVGAGLTGVIESRKAPYAHVGRRPTGDKPNVVCILLDALRADYVGCYGRRVENCLGDYVSPTPNLDRVAAEGTVCESAYGHSITRYSMFSLHCGQIRSAFDPTYTGRFTRHFSPTFPELFRDNGYKTQTLTGNPVHYTFSQNTRGYKRRDIFFGQNYFLDGRWHRHTDAHGAFIDVKKMLDGIGREPFMWYIHIVPPHAPYDPYKDFAEHFDDGNGWPKELDPYLGEIIGAQIGKGKDPPDFIRNHLEKITPNYLDHIRAMYAASVYSADWFVGKVVNQLEYMGILENTVLVVMSDHGEEFLEHGGIMHDGSMYEEDTRIPLVFRYPYGVGVGKRIRDLVSIADVPATMLFYAGMLSEGEKFGDGRSLHEALTKRKRKQHRERVISEAVGVAIREREQEREWKAVVYDWQIPRKADPSRAVWRRNIGEKPSELYDLATDPGERHNLASELPELVDEFTEVAEDYVERGSDLWYEYVPKHGGPKTPDQIIQWNEELMRVANRAAWGADEEREAVQDVLGDRVAVKDLINLDLKLEEGRVSREALERLQALGYAK